MNNATLERTGFGWKEKQTADYYFFKQKTTFFLLLLKVERETDSTLVSVLEGRWKGKQTANSNYFFGGWGVGVGVERETDSKLV